MASNVGTSTTALILMFLAACSRGSSTRLSTTEPSPFSPPAVEGFSGIWRVSYRMVRGVGCNTFPSGQTAETVFRFAQTGDSVVGSMFGADVTGLEAQGEATLSGLKLPAASFDSRVEVRATLRLVDQIASFTGTFHVVQTFAVSCGIPLAFDAEILTANRVPFDSSPASYAGTWRGNYVVQSCTKIGWRDCYPEQAGGSYSFYLELIQAGSSVTGRLILDHAPSLGSGDYDIVVTGSGDAGQLVLRGTWKSTDGRSSTRLLTWSTTRDVLGRMNGSFSYTSDYQTISDVYSSTYDATTVGVSLDPRS